jgi:hypothetical protein
MVADPDKEAPPLAGKGKMGRRRRRRREPAYAWWVLFGALGAVAWLLRSWRVGLLVLLLWCLYEFCLVPTVCRITTRQGFWCVEPVRGRLFACTPAHQQVKNDALWWLIGLRNPFRKRQLPDTGRNTGVLVVSPVVRARLDQTDRIVLILAGGGTLLTAVCAVSGYF